ncbi:MAG: helicase [Bacteroides sp. SM23_62]|nr:MAG: helicase [Bacteroides sp. SM23_62]
MQNHKTTKLEMAARFINSTDSHLFLTGKAGTGKTTFLRQLADETHKSYLIVAPTGIAALNAEGVTIHSQFLLPFGSFIPEREPVTNLSETTRFYTKHTLTRVHTLNSMRRKVLRATELIIIDEVSMLRADILDAIDFRMRSAKGNFAKSFGGTQLLMTGDLHQLPPIVNDEEWSLLQRYYRSMHFFEAQAFREEKMVYIELDRIFRQHDDRFIRILNNLRNNTATKEDIAILNSHYHSEKQIGTEQEAITITTHNYIADSINRKKLEALPAHSVFFEADIYGDFPENLYPLPMEIELKEGARVMFIKNDSSEEKSYVNGKLARVDRIEDDEIVVVMSGTGQKYTLRKEVWENKRYIINEDTKEVEEEVIGSFEQYPVKLAWAVTVHKSQGLTFEKAIIDVGQAFASGQVYVALSRLQSLDGLILRTRINTSSIMNDRDVLEFSCNMGQQKPLPELLHERQRLYMEQILGSTFDFFRLTKQLEYLQESMAGKLKFEDEGMEKAIEMLLERFKDEKKNTSLFRSQLQRLLQQNNRKMLLERIAKGSAYYTAFMEENLKQLLFHLAEVMHLTRTKAYRNALSEIDQQIMIAMGKLERAEYIINSILSDRNIKIAEAVQGGHIKRRGELWKMAQKAAKEKPGSGSTKSGRKRRKSVQQEKGETYKITWAMISEGKSIREIAAIRDLASSTVERHIVRGIREGALDIFTVLQKETVQAVTELLKESSDTIGGIHNAQNGKYTHGELRMVRAYLEKKTVP